MEISITTEYIKLDQFLKLVGIAESGGHAKEIVAEGVVYVNGYVTTMRGKKIYPGDKVELDEYMFTIKATNDGN